MSKIIQTSLYLASLLIMLGACSSAPHQEAVSQSKTPELKNYVSLDLEYGRYKALLNELDKKVGTLKNRGEAHVTLITPPEFKALVAGGSITPEQIHEAYKLAALKPQDFKEICVGQSSKKIQAKKMSTYYVVIKSAAFLKFRRDVAALSKVSEKDFNPNLFFPHITLGFTERDLHYEDGVKKDAKTCLKEINIAQ